MESKNTTPPNKKMVSFPLRATGFLLAVLILVCCAFSLFLFWKADPYHLKAPSDEKLTSIFHPHHKEFEKLTQMAAEDSARGLYFSGSGQAQGDQLDETRRREYQTLLSAISPGIDMEIDTFKKNNVVRFIFVEGGLSAVGPEWLKGIEYVPGKDGYYGETSQSLDHVEKLAEGVYLRQVEPKWFLFYQFTN